MGIIAFIFECFFYVACGWFGHVLVKVITLGKIDLEWGADCESFVATIIGIAALLFIGLVII